MLLGIEGGTDEECVPGNTERLVVPFRLGLLIVILPEVGGASGACLTGCGGTLEAFLSLALLSIIVLSLVSEATPFAIFLLLVFMGEMVKPSCTPKNPIPLVAAGVPSTGTEPLAAATGMGCDMTVPFSKGLLLLDPLLEGGDEGDLLTPTKPLPASTALRLLPTPRRLQLLSLLGSLLDRRNSIIS